MQSAAAMVDAESKLAKEFAMDRALNEANDKKKEENDEALPRAGTRTLQRRKTLIPKKHCKLRKRFVDDKRQKSRERRIC